jgi:hypothetical protein
MTAPDEIVAYCHGPGRWMCTVGHGHLCEGMALQDAASGGPGGDASPRNGAPTRTGEGRTETVRAESRAATAGGALGATRAVADYYPPAGRVERLRRRLWAWRYRRVLRRRLEGTRGGRP